MARGGWNKGKPKTPGSGRKAGTLNKKTAETKRKLDEMKVDATDPLSFLASILRNPDAPYEQRLLAARELLPYSHPKLTSIEARSGGRSHEDRLEETGSPVPGGGKFPEEPHGSLSALPSCLRCSASALSETSRPRHRDPGASRTG